MKDVNVRNIPKDSIYKDVVIIGNGPSGIALSYMLAGNWPYWSNKKIQKHPDEMLRARLNYADNNKSLIEHDLEQLSEGLEGRSTNPVSLLLDSLEHPCADLGLELPSMIKYKNNSTKVIDHIVLGKGPPGGTWHKMDPNLRTLSLASWMSLPTFSYAEWEANELRKRCQNEQFSCLDCKKLQTNAGLISNDDESVILTSNNNESEPEALCCKCTKALSVLTSDINKIEEIGKTSMDSIESRFLRKHDQNLPPRRNLSLKRQVSKEVQTRALVSRVAKYYQDYVEQMILDKYFSNDANVTLIAPLSETVAQQGKFPRARWIVTGINEQTARPFYYVCRNIVLANGVSDLPNRLGIRSEQLHRSWVKHELPQLESCLEKMPENERKKLKPVLVVGAGLSAADAVTICRLSDIHVIHVYRSKTAGLDKSLPENVYPEYHEVHQMMRDPINKYEFYTPVPESTITNLSTDLKGNHRVTVKNLITSETKTFEVSFAAILIGSRPNLGFTAGINKGALKNAICITSSYITQSEQHSSPLSRKLSWLKSLCEKCKHFNFCEKNRKIIPSDYHRKGCGHLTNKSCNCYRANLQALCSVEDSGIGLGIDTSKPIDSKTNQIDVDKYTNQVQNAPKGMYAMGPLVGDNFVRFIPGGALAIASAFHKEND